MKSEEVGGSRGRDGGTDGERDGGVWRRWKREVGGVERKEMEEGVDGV